MSFTNFKTLFDSSSNGRMLIYEGCIIECNRKAPAILQIPYDDLIGKNFSHALSQTQAYGDFAEQNLSTKLALALKGENQTLDWFYLSTDQQTINIEISINSISIDHKNYAEVRLIDATKRFQLQQAINFIASEVSSDSDNSFFEKLILKLSNLFNISHAFIGLYETDSYDSIKTFVRSSHGKITENINYPIKGTPCFEATDNVPAAYPNKVQSLFPEAQCLVDMDAESYVSVPLFSSKNIPIGLLAIIDNKPMSDITHIKEIMQIYTLRIANEIERLNTNKELKNAKELAEQAYQAKAEFLSNMSHELRTPLHAILSYSDFGIKKKNLSADKLLKYFNAIHISGDRLLHLVNNLLDLSKMEAGKIQLNLTTENVSNIIQSSIEELKYASEKKNINIIFTSLATNSTLLCDKTLIHQLLLNILSNAINFSDQDSSIEIHIKNIESDNLNTDFINITVKDYGIGIPDNELDSIFNEFIQSSATKTGAGGTGLGLAISKNIVNTHHGKIWATNSKEEAGALFHITLPIDMSQVNDE